MKLGVLWIVLAARLLSGESGSDNSRNTVFQIGTFDRSSREFSTGTPKHGVEFVVSQSTPAKDWFGEQPAVLASREKVQQTSISNAPRAISFTLHGSPAVKYELHVALLVESASVPALRVVINGKRGMFYLHPRLDYSNGDQWDSFDPAYSSADVRFGFSGKYFHSGTNTIAFEVVEQAYEEVPDARLDYDAIELDSIQRDATDSTPAVQLLPTVYFRRESGGLREEVDAFIRRTEKPSGESHAELTIARRKYSAVAQDENDFGDEKLSFWVDDFDAKSSAGLLFESGGRKQHYRTEISPAKRWTVFVVPHIHLDVGYSDYQAKVAAIQTRAVGEALNMISRHSDFRFSLDGEWNLEQFLASASDEQKKRVIAAIQKRQIFVPAQYANLLTGTSGAEVLIRSLYPSAKISALYGSPLNYANITDVPSYSWSYASILAAAGIPYLAAASDNYRAPVLFQGRLNEHSPTWWVGPDGKKILLWYARSYLHMQMLFGLPPVLDAGHDTLPLFLQMYEDPSYRANSTLLFGTQVENTDLFPQQAEFVERWNQEYAYPHLQYSGFHEALEKIAGEFGDTIPTIRGDGGPYWEDGVASDARYVGMERWNEARALSAEKLNSLASLVNSQLRSNPQELNHMWTDMILMDEHTFDSWNSVSDPESNEAVEQSAFKEHFAVNAASQVDFITRRAMANLADIIPAPPGSVIVFNTLNWKRSGFVSVDLKKSDEIVDTLTGMTVPYRVLSTGNDFIRVRFEARDVPELGYKVYFSRTSKKKQPPIFEDQNPSIESQYYRIELDPQSGSIRSIYDKELKRELVSQDSPYRFAQYLYVSGGDKEPNSILGYSRISPAPNLEGHPATAGRLVSIERTPQGEVAVMESTDTNTPSIRSEIRVFDDIKKIEINEEVDKKNVYSKEAVYFAFPFAFGQPQFQYEVQNGVVDPAKDMYPGAGHEWFSVQHWISAQQDGLSATLMPLDAPLVTLGDINRGEWPEKFENRTGTIFSYVMNNYWNTNYRAGQGGHFTFHYVVTSASATHAADLSRMGWEEITPLEADVVMSQDKALPSSTSVEANEKKDPSQQATGDHASSQVSAVQGSFLESSDPNLFVETWKPAEDGNGTILRLVDIAGEERAATIRIPFLDFDQAWKTDALERGKEPVSVTKDGRVQLIIHPHEILTLRVLGNHR